MDRVIYAAGDKKRGQEPFRSLGDDVLAQTLNANAPQYLLYDGHGSTRQSVASDGSTINDSYSYDAYGVMLGGNPTTANPAATNLLYAGEQYDTDAQQYYLRARYYNQSNGTFNRVDPYAGNTQDPQSLHKYAYVHNNPVNNIDPSGMFSLVEVTITIAVLSLMSASISAVIASATGGDALKSFCISFMTNAFALALIFCKVPSPVAYAIGAFLSNFIWEGYVEGFRYPELSAAKIVLATVIAFIFSYVCSYKLDFLSVDAQELSVIIGTCGLKDITKEIASILGKKTGKSLFLGVMNKIISTGQELIEHFYMMLQEEPKRKDEIEKGIKKYI